MEVELHLIRDYHDRADADEYHADGDEGQNRDSENIAGMPQKKPPSAAIGVVQPSDGNGQERYCDGQRPEQPYKRSERRKEKREDGCRHDGKYGQPEFAPAGTSSEFRISVEESFDGIAETALMVGRPLAVPPLPDGSSGMPFL